MYRFALVTSLDLLTFAIDDRPGWGFDYHDLFTSVHVPPADTDITGLGGQLMPGGILFVVAKTSLQDEQYEALSGIGVGSLEIAPDIQLPLTDTLTGYRIGLPSNTIRDVVRARTYLCASWQWASDVATDLALFAERRVAQIITCPVEDPPVVNEACGAHVRGILVVDDQWSLSDFDIATRRMRSRISPYVSFCMGFSTNCPGVAGTVHMLIHR